jgi:hypothetical protein
MFLKITRFNLTSLGQPLKPDIVSLASWLEKRRDSYKKVVAMGAWLLTFFFL